MACNNMCTSSDSRGVVLEGCRLTRMALETQDHMAPSKLAACMTFYLNTCFAPLLAWLVFFVELVFSGA